MKKLSIISIIILIISIIGIVSCVYIWKDRFDIVEDKKEMKEIVSEYENLFDNNFTIELVSEDNPAEVLVDNYKLDYNNETGVLVVEVNELNYEVTIAEEEMKSVIVLGKEFEAENSTINISNITNSARKTFIEEVNKSIDDFVSNKEFEKTENGYSFYVENNFVELEKTPAYTKYTISNLFDNSVVEIIMGGEDDEE